MGACSSCLGRRDRDGDDEGQNEEGRLLYDDGSAMQYGSFGEAALTGDDAAEAQRENEALQRVVAKTSNNMVDVFEIAPHHTLGRGDAFAYALVSRLSADEDGGGGGGGGGPAGIKVDWLADEGGEALSNGRAASVQTVDDDGGWPLVGTFADAAAAAAMQ